jgi:superfamily II DNA or RNA helicase
VVVDVFHLAAAPTYRGLLAHLRPRFLLGLIATPERTDRSDLLSLCDDNLVYTRSLFDGVELGHLSPFAYYGIYDETVDYREIPWRNGRFDPNALSARLATLARARHPLKHWRDKAQSRTLAFCVSTAHVDFMAERFQREGIHRAAVYRGSALDRGEALDRLGRGSHRVFKRHGEPTQLNFQDRDGFIPPHHARQLVAMIENQGMHGPGSRAAEIQRLILEMPFRKFAQRTFLD